MSTTLYRIAFNYIVKFFAYESYSFLRQVSYYISKFHIIIINKVSRILRNYDKARGQVSAGIGDLLRMGYPSHCVTNYLYQLTRPGHLSANKLSS